MSAEHAGDKDRGFYASWPQVGVPAGLGLGTLVTALLTKGLSPDAFLAYGWRIGFLFSALLVLIGIYIRLRILETPMFELLLEAFRSYRTAQGVRRRRGAAARGPRYALARCRLHGDRCRDQLHLADLDAYVLHEPAG